MPFAKMFSPNQFLDVLDDSWKPTSEIAKAVGCSRSLADTELTRLASDKRKLIQMRKAKAGGRFKYVKQWRKTPEKIQDTGESK